MASRPVVSSVRWKLMDSHCTAFEAAIAFIAMRTGRVVAAFHSLSQTFPIGTLRAMIESTGWQDEDLQRLGLID